MTVKEKKVQRVAALKCSYVSIGQEERQRMYVMYSIPKIYKVKEGTSRKNDGAGVKVKERARRLRRTRRRT